MTAPPEQHGETDPPADRRPDDGAGAELSALRRYRAAARQRRASGDQFRRSGLRRSAIMRTGSGPDSRDPQPLASVLRRLTDERGWTRDFAVWSLTNRWPEIVGPQVAVHVVVERFEEEPATGPADSPGNRPQHEATAGAPQQQELLAGPEATEPAHSGGALTLRADSPAWREQIVWNLAALQRRLDEELGRGTVGRIIVLGPEPPRRTYGRRRVTR